MPHDVISTCPVCSSELTVTRLHCASCGTAIEGEFRAGRFAGLSREQMALLESFLRSRGNLREMERELGLSYPTVRSRVDALVRAVGLGEPAEREERDEEAAESAESPEPSEPGVGGPAGVNARRREILEQLARHEIGAQEAAAQIRELSRRTR